jgi:hypothetical protein
MEKNKSKNIIINKPKAKILALQEINNIKKSNNNYYEDILAEINKTFDLFTEAYSFADDSNAKQAERNIAHSKSPLEFALKDKNNYSNYNVQEASNLISQIRKLALQGISKLSDATNMPEYDIFKKIWTLCEKKIIETNKESQDNNNINNINN